VNYLLVLPEINTIHFYEGERERIEIAKKYPVKKIDRIEDANKVLIRELPKD
jgi:hypothetical protein